MQQFYKDVGVKYGYLFFSAAYCMWVQYGARDNTQEAFYDFIESIKVGHLCGFYYTTLQRSSGQHNMQAPAVYTSVLYL